MRGLGRNYLVCSAVVLPLLGMAIASVAAPDSLELKALVAAVTQGRARLDPRAWQRPWPPDGEPGSAEAAYWQANAAAARGDWDAAFVAIEAGTRRRDVYPELPWTTGAARQLTDGALARVEEPFRTRLAAQVAAADVDAAVALVQATLTFGVDLTHRPFPVEWAIGGRVAAACIEAIEIRLLPYCNGAQLRRLSTVIASLDAWARPAIDARIVQLLHAQEIVDGDRHAIEWLRPAWVPWWRSAQQCAATRKLEYLAILDELAATATNPWPQRDAALRRADEGLAVRERSWRQRLTRLRLLRLRLAFMVGDALPELQDPLGHGAIHQAITGDEATFTAVDAACRVVRQPAAASPKAVGSGGR